MSAAIDANEAFVGTVEPEGADRLDEVRLTEWMEANVEGFEGPLHLTKFKGGQSNPTYKVEAKSQNYVLRRKPIGRPHAHPRINRHHPSLSKPHPPESDHL